MSCHWYGYTCHRYGPTSAWACSLYLLIRNSIPKVSITAKIQTRISVANERFLLCLSPDWIFRTCLLNISFEQSRWDGIALLFYWVPILYKSPSILQESSSTPRLQWFHYWCYLYRAKYLFFIINTCHAHAHLFPGYVKWSVDVICCWEFTVKAYLSLGFIRI